MLTLLKVGSYSSTFLYRACPSTIVGLHDITLRKTTGSPFGTLQTRELSVLIANVFFSTGSKFTVF